MPLRELSHRREAGAEGDDIITQHRGSDLDDNSWDVTSSRPFMPRVRRELLERDEIGMALSEIPEKLTSYYGADRLYSARNTGRSAQTYPDVVAHG